MPVYQQTRRKVRQTRADDGEEYRVRDFLSKQ